MNDKSQERFTIFKDIRSISQNFCLTSSLLFSGWRRKAIDLDIYIYISIFCKYIYIYIYKYILAASFLLNIFGVLAYLFSSFQNLQICEMLIYHQDIPNFKQLWIAKAQHNFWYSFLFLNVYIDISKTYGFHLQE